MRELGEKSQDFSESPHPWKVLRRGAPDRSPPFVRDFFPMEREFWRFWNGKQEKRRSGRAGRGKSGVVYAGTDGARADRGAGALCAKCEDTQREPDRADQSEPAGVWLCQSGNHRQRPEYHRRTRARAGGQGRGHDRGALRAGRAPDGRTAACIHPGRQPPCGAVRLGHRDAGARARRNQGRRHGPCVDRI